MQLPNEDLVIDTATIAPPGRTRSIGRSRTYTVENLPAHYRQWHAPRANRWERLDVVAGSLDIEWLNAGDVTQLRLGAGEKRWIAPGSRWRISLLSEDGGFELEVHADETVAADAPQIGRAAFLDALAAAQLDDPVDLQAVLDALEPGGLRLVRAGFDFSEAVRTAIQGSSRTLFWHPLEIGTDGSTALVGRSPTPVGIADYLGRDHAVIEGALAGALRGNAEQRRWLHNLLARHLVIEEEVLFPLFIEAGGRSDWVESLTNDHNDLRQFLPRIDNPAVRRRFLLQLDGHDEREEQIVYPDILERLREHADALADQVLSYRPAREPERIDSGR